MAKITFAIENEVVCGVTGGLSLNPSFAMERKKQQSFRQLGSATLVRKGVVMSLHKSKSQSPSLGREGFGETKEEGLGFLLAKLE